MGLGEPLGMELQNYSSAEIESANAGELNGKRLLELFWPQP